MTIENLFVDWGRAQKQLPANNKILKNHALGHLIAVDEPKTSRLPWLSLALATTAVITFIISIKPANITPVTEQTNSTFNAPNQATKTQSITDSNTLNYQSEPTAKKPPTSEGTQAPNAAAPASGQSASNNQTAPVNNYNYHNIQSPPIQQYTLPNLQQVPVADNREFIKTDYAASILARHVLELTQHIQTTIHGFGGRIDSSTNGEKLAYLSFALPADKFDAFRQELVSLVGERFVKESIQTTNFLPQKISIEDQQKTVNTNLSLLQTSRSQAVSAHNQTVRSLQAQINSDKQQLTNLQNQWPSYQIQIEEQTLTDQISSLQARLKQENINYQRQITALDAQIQDAQNSLSQLGTQTNQLIDNVATVQGTITISWISIWDLINLYVYPGYWFALLLIVGAIVAYTIHRRQNKFIIP